jgi:hypothetical protein
VIGSASDHGGEQDGANYRRVAISPEGDMGSDLPLSFNRMSGGQDRGLSRSGPTLRFSGPPDCHEGQEAGEAPRPAEGISDKR